MKEMAAAIDGFIDSNRPERNAADVGDLGNAAVKLSAWLLRNCTGDLLRRGLRVCESLAEFDAGLIDPEVLKVQRGA